MRSGVGRGRLVVFDVRLRGLGGVMRSVLMMAVREMRVVRGGFVLPCFVMLGGFFVMTGRVFVVFGCRVMMFSCYF
jgi:hypothetical protein